MKVLIKKLLHQNKFPLKPSKEVQFFRFGYNPCGYLREDITNCFFGTKNLYKHYQAKKIFQALNLKTTDRVLDFGCGSGYMSIEIAKLAEFTLGVDINPNTRNIPVPDFLKDKLRFEVFEETLFQNQFSFLFDKILLSEVILSVPSRDNLLQLCSKLLKPKGEIILVNGLGKHFIKRFIFKNITLIKFLKPFFPRLPETYECYEEIFCKQCGNSTQKLFAKDEIINLFQNHHYVLSVEMFSPKKWIVNIIELKQFIQFITQGKGTSFFSFVLLRGLFSLINLIQKKNTDSGFIAIFSKA